MRLNKPTWTKKLTEYFWKNAQPLDALLIIDNGGNILDHKVSLEIKKTRNADWLKKIANKVSIRFKIVDYTKELGGLAMTINVFHGKIMLVKVLSQKHTLVLLIPRGNNLTQTINTVSDFVDDSNL